jgi:hypothetical protein
VTSRRIAGNEKTPMKIVALGISALAAVGAAQGPAAPATADLVLTVTRFFETAEQYARTFRNLTVEETRILEEFDESGRVKKRREIVADLVVYRPARSGAGENDVREYRDARLVDGKAVARRDKRALDLITRATTRGSLAEELQVINRENQRYDLRFRAGPFTISQIPRSTMREDWDTLPITQHTFRFNWVGPTQVNGHDVVELEYRETMPLERHPAVNGDFYKGMGLASFFERGRLWLDATTYQVRRSRWEIAGVHPALPAPMQLISVESTYVESRFGILVPARIVVEWYENVKSKAESGFVRAARTTYTYGAFRQFGVTTDEAVATPAGR